MTTPSLPRFFSGFLAGFVFTAVCFGVLVWASLGRPIQGLEKNARFVECRPLMIQATAGTRCFLAGGSSVGNGISARAIQEATGIPTYNYSYWASMGPAFILDQVKKVARPGDVVVLALEYELYDWDGDQPYWLDEGYIYFTASHERQFVESRPLGEQVQYFLRVKDRTIMDLLFRTPRSAEPGATLADMKNWDANGDETGNTAATKPTTPSVLVSIRTPIAVLVKGFSRSPKGFPIIKSFVDWAATNRVVVLATYPNLADSPAYAAPPAQEAFAQIRNFYQALGVPVVGSEEEARVPVSDCYNTVYHPTHEYALQRTQVLIKHLAPYLKR